jgi:DNA-binding LacI/PurR family transcriptional regulator
MITIKDVARESGFSVTTVSRALNNYSDVNVNSKKHIVEVANELGYVPNKMAQNLVKQESKTIAFILSGLFKDGGRDNIVYQLFTGMYSYAESIGYDVALYTTDSSHQKKKSYVRFCKEHNISGAMLAGIKMDDPYLKELLKSKMPCILDDIDLESDHVSIITVNNEEAAKEAVQLLIDNNHKRIGCILGREVADVTVKRFNGYKKALASNNIDFDESITGIGNFTEEESYSATLKILKEKKDVTAFFCHSDIMAIGCIRAIRELGLDVPKDISIIGFDNIPLAQYFNPPLATVDQNFYEMGFQGAKQLVKMIKDKGGKEKIYLEHKILARNTISMLL